MRQEMIFTDRKGVKRMILMKKGRLLRRPESALKQTEKFERGFSACDR